MCDISNFILTLQRFSFVLKQTAHQYIGSKIATWTTVHHLLRKRKTDRTDPATANSVRWQHSLIPGQTASTRDQRVQQSVTDAERIRKCALHDRHVHQSCKPVFLGMTPTVAADSCSLAKLVDPITAVKSLPRRLCCGTFYYARELQEKLK